MARRRRDGRQPHPRDFGVAARARRRPEQSTLRANRPSPRLPIRRARQRSRRLRGAGAAWARCTVRGECRALFGSARMSSLVDATKGGGARVLGDRAGRGRCARYLAEPESDGRGPRAAATTQRAVRLFQPPPDGSTIVSGGVLSPDGASLTFVARDIASGETALWVRALHSSALKRIESTEGAVRPFWSPDSGRPRVLHQRRAQGRRPARRPRAAGRVRRHQRRRRNLGPDDTILFADWAKGLYTVRASGSEPALVAALDPTARDIADRVAAVLTPTAAASSIRS